MRLSTALIPLAIRGDAEPLSSDPTHTVAPIEPTLTLTTANVLNKFAPVFSTLTLKGTGGTATTFENACPFSASARPTPAPPFHQARNEPGRGCWPVTLTQGPYTWAWVLDDPTLGSLSMNCTFGSGGVTAGDASCTTRAGERGVVTDAMFGVTRRVEEIAGKTRMWDEFDEVVVV
ncbi:hypothetical protein K491DRAFT_685131 [Lophiostoma macrostomum CBS 122681]|uniref:Uncharacterized protein n=1 Tax=Lophiostoma macrostomum CBS 122681 TaxID=1314788 RepID=A0A6A6SLR6_9PLEO|nr:hypothetical protein K491DRAFT_685131 [Lophiostoma macrostomum CBS 122681]